MSSPIRISTQTARRFLINALGLDSMNERNTTEQTWRQLGAIQLDPVATIERNHHLVLMGRVPDYQKGSFSQLLEAGLAFEYWANEACILPIEDYPLFEYQRKHRQESFKSELSRYAATVTHVKHVLHEQGPLSSRDFASTSKVYGGWDLDKATTKESSHVLSLLHRTGDIQVVKREGATRYFDLTEKVIPQELLLRASDISPTEASHLLLQKYYRSYRLFSANDARYGWQKFKAVDRRSIHQNMINDGHIVPVEIEGVDRTYAVLAEDVELLQNDLSSSTTNYVQFLPPLDNLLWSRDRLVDIFSFYYRWEIYIPKEKRQFGAYGMPILDQDQLIGKMDPLFDRKNGTLIVQNLTVDPGFKQTKSRLKRIEKGLTLLAKQIGADKVQWNDK